MKQVFEPGESRLLQQVARLEGLGPLLFTGTLYILIFSVLAEGRRISARLYSPGGMQVFGPYSHPFLWFLPKLLWVPQIFSGRLQAGPFLGLLEQPGFSPSQPSV